MKSINCIWMKKKKNFDLICNKWTCQLKKNIPLKSTPESFLFYFFSLDMSFIYRIWTQNKKTENFIIFLMSTIPMEYHNRWWVSQAIQSMVCNTSTALQMRLDVIQSKWTKPLSNERMSPTSKPSYKHNLMRSKTINQRPLQSLLFWLQ